MGIHSFEKLNTPMPAGPSPPETPTLTCEDILLQTYGMCHRKHVLVLFTRKLHLHSRLQNQAKVREKLTACRAVPAFGARRACPPEPTKPPCAKEAFQKLGGLHLE